MSRSMAEWRLQLESDAWVLQAPTGRFSQMLEGASPMTALRRLDTDEAKSKGALKVVIGDAWLRYLLTAWPEGVRRAAEREAYLAHRFGEVHGVAAPDWRIEVDRSAWEAPALACAVPAALVAALQDFASSRRLRLDGIRGDFVDAYNRLRRSFREPRRSLAALAVARDGRATVGMWCDGEWKALRSRALDRDDSDAVRLMLEGWLCSDPALGAKRAGTGVLYADGMEASVPAGWRAMPVGDAS